MLYNENERNPEPHLPELSGIYKGLLFHNLDPLFTHDRLEAIRVQDASCKTLRSYVGSIMYHICATWGGSLYYGRNAVYSGGNLWVGILHLKQWETIVKDATYVIDTIEFEASLRYSDNDNYEHEVILEANSAMIRRHVAENLCGFMKVLQTYCGKCDVVFPFQVKEGKAWNAKDVEIDLSNYDFVHADTQQATTHMDAPQTLDSKPISPIDLPSTEVAHALLSALRVLGVMDITNTQFALHFTVKGKPLTAEKLKSGGSYIRKKKDLSKDTKKAVEGLTDDILTTIALGDTNDIKGIADAVRRYMNQ